MDYPIKTKSPQLQGSVVTSDQLEILKAMESESAVIANIINKITRNVSITKAEYADFMKALEDSVKMTQAEVEQFKDLTAVLRDSVKFMSKRNETQILLRNTLRSEISIAEQLKHLDNTGQLLSKREYDNKLKTLDIDKARFQSIKDELSVYRNLSAEQQAMLDGAVDGLQQQILLQKELGRQRELSSEAEDISKKAGRRKSVNLRIALNKKLGFTDRAKELEDAKKLSQESAKRILSQGGTEKEALEAAKVPFSGGHFPIKAIAVGAIVGIGKLVGKLFSTALGLMKKALGIFKNAVQAIWKRVLEIDVERANYIRTVGATSNALAGATVPTTVMDLVQKFQNLKAIADELQADPLRIIDAKNLGVALSDMKLLGLSAKEAAGLVLQMRVLGTTAKNLELTGDRIYKKEFEAGKITVTRSQFHKQILQTDNSLLLTTGANVDRLTRAVAEANKLGLELKDIQGIGDNLVNFESSISAEMEAQLMTREQLSLSQARIYAIQGDYEALSREINKQGITESKYLSWNVLQRQAIAKALGMSNDQLAKYMIQQAKSNGLSDEEIARLRGVNLEESRRIDLQERWNTAIARIRDAFSEPFTGMIDDIVGAAGNIANFVAKDIAPLVRQLAGVLKPITEVLSELLRSQLAKWSLDVNSPDFKTKFTDKLVEIKDVVSKLIHWIQTLVVGVQLISTVMDKGGYKGVVGAIKAAGVSLGIANRNPDYSAGELESYINRDNVYYADGVVSFLKHLQLPSKTNTKAAGGIIPGTSYTGDHIPAWVNSGEMVLTTGQQSELWRLATGQGNRNSSDSRYAAEIAELKQQVAEVGRMMTNNTNRQIAAIEASRPDWNWVDFDKNYAMNAARS